MKIEIRYFSKTGNTKKIAQAISLITETPAKSIEDSVIEADILFLGGALYAGKINKDLQNFIESLDNKKIKKVVIFSTTMGSESAYKELKKYLDKKKITVLENNYHCRGKFLFFQRSRPDERDIENAKEFAKEILEGEKK